MVLIVDDYMADAALELAQVDAVSLTGLRIEFEGQNTVLSGVHKGQTALGSHPKNAFWSAATAKTKSLGKSAWVLREKGTKE